MRPRPLMRMGTLLIACCLVASLSNCTTSDVTREAAETVRPQVPSVPAEYRSCFTSLVVLPKPGPKGEWTQQQLAEAYRRARTSEAKKNRCGGDLVNWSDDVLNGVRGGPPQ